MNQDEINNSFDARIVIDGGVKDFYSSCNKLWATRLVIINSRKNQVSTIIPKGRFSLD